MANDESTALSQWFEEHTRSLAPPADWQPDVNAARARFAARRHERSGPARSLLAGAAAVSLATIALAVSPAARAVAEYCWRCVTTGSFVPPLANLPNAAEEPSGAAIQQGESRKLAPDFALQDAEGKEVRLSDFRGQVVLLNFWATWCIPCRIEIPWFAELEQSYKDRGFAVVGVSLDAEGWDAVTPFLTGVEVNYRVVIGDDQTAARFGVTALPTTFLIDRGGRIAALHEGLTSKKDLAEGVTRLLKTP